MSRAVPPDDLDNTNSRSTLKGWRTVIFHSAYGVPMAVIGVLDITKEVDVTPILSRFMNIDDVPFVLACIAIVSVGLRMVTSTRMGDQEGPQ
jgi:hypothetical protein